MYKIYNKKLILGSLCSKTLGLIIQITDNFALALRTKPII